MSIIFASCLTFSAMLAQAQPGDTIRLEGRCRNVKVERKFTRQVTIDASRAQVAGLQLLGANIAWTGGTLTAFKGDQGIARDGYAVYIEGTNIQLAGATLTGARNGIVVVKSRGIRIDSNRFVRLRNDGINASQTDDLTIERNSFTDPRSNPNTCNGVATDRARRFCKGVWKGGDHAGAVQLRNAVTKARLRYNTVVGAWGGGLSQNDRKGVDAPLRDVVIADNRISAATYTPIQIQANCIGCRVDRNVVRNGRKDWKATIRYGAALHCGNDVEAGPADPRC